MIRVERYQLEDLRAMRIAATQPVLAKQGALA